MLQLKQADLVHTIREITKIALPIRESSKKSANLVNIYRETENRPELQITDYSTLSEKFSALTKLTPSNSRTSSCSRKRIKPVVQVTPTVSEHPGPVERLSRSKTPKP